MLVGKSLCVFQNEEVDKGVKLIKRSHNLIGAVLPADIKEQLSLQ